ncbi:uncharacterized protein [Littorina saxatilis]|uniref:uncharacterized protein n=1 Tax=Littorina saxatilis TaxID=31220 RepID=UPI0038B681FC
MPSRNKYKTFVDGPIQDKPLTALPGVGEKLAARLTNADIPDAKALLGGFLRVQGDETRFFEWMREKCAANRRQADECYACLKEWTHRNIPKMHDLAYEQVTNIPCLQGPLSERLSNAGFRYAKDIFGLYLQQGEDQEKFTAWLVETHEANDHQAAQCFTFLQEWSGRQFRERNPLLAAGQGAGGQTTQKHRTFVNEPMGDKDVTHLPGIGQVTGRKMNDEGFKKVSSLKICIPLLISTSQGANIK